MKVTANLSSYPPRFKTLQQVVDSLINQVDIVRVYCNEVKHLDTVKSFFKGKGYDGRLLLINGCDQDYNLTDNGKFYSLENITEPEIYLTCDDDLIYPPDYVKRVVEAINRYKCIVSFHGRQLLGTGMNYYTDHRAFLALLGVISDVKGDVVGTGVCGFDTRYFHPKGLAFSPDHKMSDLIFSLEAAKQGKQLGIISHGPNWIKHIDNKETIFETESVKGTPRQNEIADEIFRLRHGKH